MPLEKTKTLYSVIIPIYNERDNLELLICEVEAVMEALGEPWELLCVDDGSTDGSLAVIQNLMTTHLSLRLIPLAKNYGQSTAFAAGFAAAKGKFFITLDADGQNDPRDIPKLITAIPDADLVVGWRITRKDSWSKKLISVCANALRSRLCRDGVHDTGCSLKIFRATALKKIKLYQGMHRFFPALFLIEGLRVKEVPVNHRERHTGISKYHFWNRSLGPILDMFVVQWMRHRHLSYTLREERSP